MRIHGFFNSVIVFSALVLPATFFFQFAFAQDDDWEARVDRITDRYQELYRAGDYQKALDYLENEIESSTRGIPILWLRDRARFNAEMGRVEDALSDMEWLQIQRPSPRNALLLAELYFLKGSADAARATLEEARDRFGRARRFAGEVGNELALLRIRELLGENPRSIFQGIIDKQDDDTSEEQLLRHLAAGDFAYRKFDYQLASNYFEKALALDPEELDAFAGLARCYWRSFDPRLEQTLETVLAVNPKHPDILEIQAEQALDSGKTEEALEFIELALERNPKDTRFVSLKIAALFLDGNLDTASDLQRWVLSFNPRASEVHRIPGRIASRHYRFKEAAEMHLKALTINPDDNEARALLAFDRLRMGEDETGRALLQEAFEKDRFNVQVYNMLELQDVLDQFATLERDGFKVRMPSDEASIWGGEALDLLTDAHQDMRKRYQVKLELPVHVQIFDNHDDFMVRSIGLPGNVGHLGICFGKLITMDSPSARGGGGMNWRATLWHEFAHVITLQKTGNRIPRWLSEGISVYEEFRKDDAWGERLNPAFKVATTDGLPSLDSLPRLFSEPRTSAHLLFGYFSAGQFVRFYVDAFGFEALVGSLDRIAKGEDALAALAAAASVDSKSLGNQFKTFFEERTAALDNIATPPEPGMGGLVQVQSEAKFDLAMQRANLAATKEDWDAVERALRDAHALFPEYAGEGAPLAQLAALYDRLGKDDERKQVLESWLALDASDLELCRSLAEIYVASSAWEQLEKVSYRGLSIDPFDVKMRRLLWQAQEARGVVNEGLSNLSTLIKLDTVRAVDYRLARIDLLRDAGEKSRAKSELLRLLEDVPYAWEAQRRLLEISGTDVKP